MTYVLLLIVAMGGGLSAEFNSKEACEAALAKMKSAAEPQEVLGFCVEKG